MSSCLAIDYEQEMRARQNAGTHYIIEPRVFYPGALATLQPLKNTGYLIGIAGNQPEETETALKACGMPADYMVSSARWHVEKPSPEFFERIVAITGLAPSEVAYVGDRLDNDVLPAQKAGMYTVFLVLGPWGFLHAQSTDTLKANAKTTNLLELPITLKA